MLLIIFMLMVSNVANSASVTLKEAQEILRNHDAHKAMVYKSQAIKEKSEATGAWGDPMLMVAANNLPKDKGYKRDVTPMSGIVFGISQKLPLGPRLSLAEDAMLLKSKEMEANADYTLQLLNATLWRSIINERRQRNDLNYLRENQTWLESMVKVSKKLYANGKTTQQSLLDIQIRLNQVKANVLQKKVKLEEVKASQNYLIGEGNVVDMKSVDWNFLKKIKNSTDIKEKSLEMAALSAQNARSAARWSKLPEVTLGVNYTKRSNIDRNGDFVSVSISFPMPFGDTTNANANSANQEWLASQSELKAYKDNRKTTLQTLTIEGESLKEEFELVKQSLSFARTAREVSAKSYKVGSLSYQDLLQAELRLQEMEFKFNEVEAKLAENRLQIKLWNSDLLL